MFLCNSHLHKNDDEIPSKHPWEGTIRPALANKIKYVHNSVKNAKYPAPKKNNPQKDRVKYTVIGNRITKEFIYCSNMVKGLYKYRPQNFETPTIRGVTSVEWPHILHKLKDQYGGLAFCLQSQVAVIINEKFLGGEKELYENIRENYHYHIHLDYCKEAKENFVNFIRSSERPCVYMHISIHDQHIGTLIFMLYSDIVPKTCENFLRLCQTTKGGYSGTPVHRIVKDCWIQCGGFGLKSKTLNCENFIVPHDRRGVVCMANDGRNVDCSTQFFVLLQPAPWMAHKYVAFGQLIEGDETLQKIESVPTWYESPTWNIVIYRAGILNLESQNITVSDGTKEYLEGHIENLIALGKVLFAELLQNVFKVIREKALKNNSTVVSEYGEQLEQMEHIAEDLVEENMNLRATKRFIGKIEDMDIMRAEAFEASDYLWENNEFDVEEYECVPEEKEAYHHVSLAESVDVKPYYIPLTDVPYPGEVDSTFDLIKFFKGDYCLEYDLETVASKKYIRPKLSFPSEVFHDSDGSGSIAMSLDSEDEMELKKYLKSNAGRLSFAGNVVKNIARSTRGRGMHNIFENVRRSDLVTDEDLRKFRKVCLSVSEDKVMPKKIVRRQTGYIRNEDIAALGMKPASESNIDMEKYESETFRKEEQRPMSLQKIGFPISSVDSSELAQQHSAFAHLLDYSATTFERAPTFKGEMQKTNASKTVLLKRSNQHLKSSENVRDMQLPMSMQPYEQVLNLRHGKLAAHKISSDYVNTIDQIEHRCETSIRSIEYAKTRPSMTVSTYQLKNRKFNEEMKNNAAK